MDVHCCNCGESWDQYSVRHELPEDGEEFAADGWKFGSNRLVILHCPCCPPDGGQVRGSRERARAQVVQTLADLLGEDEDGLAATLEEFGR